MNELETLFHRWQLALSRRGQEAANARDSAVKEARKLAQRPSSQVTAETWLAERLQGGERAASFFAATVLDGIMPKRLLSAMIAAAVREPDPSFNRSFVQPAVRCAGPARVAKELNRIFREGPTQERTGALAALYHVPFVAQRFGLGFEGVQRVPQEELLDTFLRTDSVALRREILPSLKLANLITGKSAAEARRVVELCRASTDDYLRTRVEVQLGGSTLLPPLPPRHS